MHNVYVCVCIYICVCAMLFLMYVFLYIFVLIHMVQKLAEVVEGKTDKSRNTKY
jgi:hypothetical protein